MKQLKLILLTTLILLVLAGCGQADTPETEAPTLPPPTDEVAQVEEETEAPTATAQPEATETAEPTATAVEEAPTAAPTDSPDPTEEPEEEEVAEVEMDNCMSCHSDKERLIETADPVEEEGEAAESSGVG